MAVEEALLATASALSLSCWDEILLNPFSAFSMGGCSPLEYKWRNQKIWREAHRLWEKEDRLNKRFGGKPGVGLRFFPVSSARQSQGMNGPSLPGNSKTRPSRGSDLGTGGGHRLLETGVFFLFTLFNVTLDGNSLLFNIVLCLLPLGIWQNYSFFLCFVLVCGLSLCVSAMTSPSGMYKVQTTLGIFSCFLKKITREHLKTRNSRNILG